MARTTDTHFKPSEPEALKDDELNNTQGGASSLITGQMTEPDLSGLEMNGWLEAAKAGQMQQATTGKVTGKRMHKP